MAYVQSSFDSEPTQMDFRQILKNPFFTCSSANRIIITPVSFGSLNQKISKGNSRSTVLRPCCLEQQAHLYCSAQLFSTILSNTTQQSPPTRRTYAWITLSQDNRRNRKPSFTIKQRDPSRPQQSSTFEQWASNNTRLQDLCLEEGTADNNFTVNDLGLHWNTITDTLALIPKQISSTTCLATKREMLQNSSKIYDSVGMLSPVTVRAKMLMQDLWQRNAGWDEPLPQNLREDWTAMVKDTVQLQQPSPSPDVWLQTLKAMAERNATHIDHRRLTSQTVDDSQTVLYWLYGNKRLKQFVNNRVENIKQLFPESLWGYCPKSNNSADLLTRRMTAIQLTSSFFW